MSELASLSPAFHADQYAISRQQYWQLLHNPQQLRLLHQTTSVEQFVGLMAQFLTWPNLTLEYMSEFIKAQQQVLLTQGSEQHGMSKPPLELVAFSQAWQPYRYCEKTKTVSWVPAFRPLSEPFLEDSLSEARRCLLATFIQPVTLLAPLLAQRRSVPEVVPELMIFHWSRCGSTLVSSSFAKLDRCLVLSEPVLCSQVLHDCDWPQPIKMQLVDLCLRLQGRIRHQAQPTSATKTELIVKWNAWDLAYWPLLLTLYPRSRVLCLIRQPQAILASHQRLVGRQMINSSALISRQWHSDVLQHLSEDPRQEYYGLGVLQHLAQLTTDLMQACQTSAEPALAAQNISQVAYDMAPWRPVLLDYQQLVQCDPEALSALLAWPLTLDELALWRRHWQFDAKQQGKMFRPVALSQVEEFPLVSSPVWQTLLASYQGLLVMFAMANWHDDSAATLARGS